MSSTDGRRDSPEQPATALDLAGGLGLGLLAFVAAFDLAAVLILFEARLLSVPTEALSAPALLVGDAFWLFDRAHVGASGQRLVLLDPASLVRVPGAPVYLVPPTVLSLAGGALAYRADSLASRRASAIRGASVAAGYLSGVAVVLLYLNLTGPLAPVADLRSLLVAGLAYPLIFGGLGGALAWHVVGQSPDERPSHGGGLESDPASAGSAVDEWDERDGHGTTTTAPPAHVHFEETLSWPERSRYVLGLFALFFVVPAAAATAVVPVRSVEDAIPVVAGDAVVVVLLLAMLRTFRQEVHVRVTDDALEIAQDPDPLWGAPGVVVPFEDVERVQYGEPGDPPIRVTSEDRKANWRSMREADGFVTVNTREHRPQRYMVRKKRNSGGGYPGGVRIGREGKPPVYVGSDRPRELAGAIADRSPGVEAVEQL